MNRYSTVREHGVQPELPPQHSSCESWLLISGWLSGTNNPGTPFKSPYSFFFLLYVLVIAVQYTVAQETALCQHGQVKIQSMITR